MLSPWPCLNELFKGSDFQSWAFIHKYLVKLCPASSYSLDLIFAAFPTYLPSIYWSLILKRALLFCVIYLQIWGGGKQEKNKAYPNQSEHKEELQKLPLSSFLRKIPAYQISAHSHIFASSALRSSYGNKVMPSGFPFCRKLLRTCTFPSVQKW